MKTHNRISLADQFRLQEALSKALSGPGYGDILRAYDEEKYYRPETRFWPSKFLSRAKANGDLPEDFTATSEQLSDVLKGIAGKNGFDIMPAPSAAERPNTANQIADLEGRVRELETAVARLMRSS